MFERIAVKVDVRKKSLEDKCTEVNRKNLDLIKEVQSKVESIEKSKIKYRSLKSSYKDLYDLKCFIDQKLSDVIYYHGQSYIVWTAIVMMLVIALGCSIRSLSLKS